MTIDGKVLRVKEFFLDWFFPGFPKSLLKDFVSTYSTVRHTTVGDHTVFLGKNYKGNDSASVYIYGTQVEVECPDGATDGLFMEVIADLLEDISDGKSLASLQFPDRSYFASHEATSWYEEERISRLKWHRTKQGKFLVGNHELKSCGMGLLPQKEREHGILVLEENYWKNAVWIEFADERLKIDHITYNIRKGDGLFDYYEDFPLKRASIVYRSGSGPGILASRRNGRIYTIGFSPGFTLDDILQTADSVENIESFIRYHIEELHQEDEKS